MQIQKEAKEPAAEKLKEAFSLVACLPQSDLHDIENKWMLDFVKQGLGSSFSARIGFF